MLARPKTAQRGRSDCRGGKSTRYQGAVNDPCHTPCRLAFEHAVTRVPELTEATSVGGETSAGRNFFAAMIAFVLASCSHMNSM